MKVLWLTPSFWPALGGLESFCGYLARGLRSYGHDILIVTNGDQPDALPPESLAGQQVVRLPISAALARPNPASILQSQRRLDGMVRGFQPDLLHLHLVGPVPMALFGLQTHQHGHFPMLVTVHDDVQKLRADGDTFLGRCLSAAVWVTTASETFLADLLWLMPSLAPRTCAIPPGLPPAPAAAEPFDHASTQFLTIGRVVRDKGIDIAIDALARIVPDWPAARLVVAGTGWALPEMQDKVAAMGFETYVHFPGAVSDLERMRLIDSSLAVLMPSRWREGFGIVAVEAAQRARPIIAAQAGALGETVRLLQNGIVLEENDAASLAAAMRRLLSDPEQAMHLGARGMEQAAHLFHVDQFSASYDALYRQIVEG